VPRPPPDLPSTRSRWSRWNEVAITTLVDNTYDGLLAGDERNDESTTQRPGWPRPRKFESGLTAVRADG